MAKPPTDYEIKTTDDKKDGLDPVFFVRRMLKTKEPVQVLAVLVLGAVVLGAVVLGAVVLGIHHLYKLIIKFLTS